MLPFKTSDPGYQGDYRVEYSDSSALDAFQRLRVGLPISQFGYTNQYGATGLFTQEVVSGTGGSTHNPNTSSVIMTTGGTASGAKCTRQSRQYFRYIPGESLMILQTGNFGPLKVNVRMRRGYFDDNNGVFFEQTGDGIFIVLRSFVTGTVVDTRVHQSEWNTDRFDGTGQSGVTLDLSKAQILIMDLEWLGVGRVRYGFVMNGRIYYCHRINNANAQETAYMTTASLPLRAEIENTGVASSSTTMQVICATVMNEGSEGNLAYLDHAVANGTTKIAVTTRRAILSIRPKATFNSIVNRGTIVPVEFSILAGTNDAFFEIVYNGTLGGSPSFVSAGGNSIAAFDVAGTTVTGGEVVASGYVVAGAGAVTGVVDQQLATRYPLVLDYAGTNPINLSVVITSMSGTTNVGASVGFREYY